MVGRSIFWRRGVGQIGSLFLALAAILVAAWPNPVAASDDACTVSGEVNVLTVHPVPEIQTIVTGFQNLCPLITVNWIRNGDARLLETLAEADTQQKNYDLIILSDARVMSRLKVQGRLMKNSLDIEKALIPGSYDPESFFHGTLLSPMGIVARPGAAVPGRWSEIARPNHFQKLAVPDPLKSGSSWWAYFSLFDRLPVIERSFSNFSRRGGVLLPGHRQAIAALVDGEANFALTYTQLLFRANLQDAGFKIVYPDEGVPAQTRPAAILADAVHKPTAQLFLAYLLSENVQRSLPARGYHTVRRDIASKGRKAIGVNIPLLNADPIEALKRREEAKTWFGRAGS